MTDNPCQRCGACCAAFRVSFYWSEADVLGLPASAIEQAGPLRVCMAGTNTASPRCVALRGAVGGTVDCSLYSRRPSPCREVQPGDEKCGRARAMYGLRALDAASIARAIAAAACLIFLPFASMPSSAAEKVVGLPCEGCEAVFDGMPVELSSRARIAGKQERGEPMTIEGVVRALDGKPRAGVVVYAYQTDAGGLYPANEKFSASARRHGMLRGWALSDAEGRYAFDTIRPGGYPGTDIPQHVHMHVVERGRCTYYIDDIVFTDDPRLTPAQRRQHDQGRAGSGIVTPAKTAEGWKAVRDISLGQRIPGYENCK